MSAECRRCGRDLDGDFKCGACDCEKERARLQAEIALVAANYKREFDENMANIAECTRLETKLAGIGKDHADDWKRIQDAEREVERLKECLAHESNLVIIAMRTLDELRAELAEWKSDCTHVHKVEDETIERLKAEVLSISNERNLAFEAFNVEKARHAAEIKELVGK